MSGELRYADVVAGVSAALAAYGQAVDDGRTDDVVAAYCADGSCDIQALGAHQGHDELRAAYSKVEPRAPQRHLVFNTHVTSWSAEEASAVSDFVFMFRRDEAWQVMLVGRYNDTLHRDGDVWRFHRREGVFIT
ncbi:MAG TPA: nuclear transport factor 2 family protein [Mycobacteriales bacterium]|jgi:hypothetical protein|nr:nuclear transport factor 2 family protein [Mycobacteriales bacterium]